MLEFTAQDTVMPKTLWSQVRWRASICERFWFRIIAEKKTHHTKLHNRSKQYLKWNSLDSKFVTRKQDYWVDSPSVVRRLRGFLAEDWRRRRRKKKNQRTYTFVHTTLFGVEGEIQTFLLWIETKRKQNKIRRLISTTCNRHQIYNDENSDLFNSVLCAALGFRVCRHRSLLRWSWFSSPSFHVVPFNPSGSFGCQVFISLLLL